MQAKPHAFTVAYDGRAKVLQSKAHIAQAFDPQSITVPLSPENQCAIEFNAIWDTGATGSVITQRVVQSCGLKPIGMAIVHTAKGQSRSNVYFVSVFLPNKVVLPQLRVTEGGLPGDADVLIGMDIIGQGDFAVTNKDGKTVFSFRIPSLERIDFVKQKPVEPGKIGRNDPCPCGSGKKYKKCCGR